MQLDKTRIAVRERGVFDTLDLAVHVFRIHLQPLCITMLIGGLPWAVANYLLIGWMLPGDLDAPDSAEQIGYYLRYLWTMGVLVSLQAPLASALATVYLGQALFVQRPPVVDTFRDVLAMLPRLIWFHLLLRGVLPAICLVVVIDRYETFSGSETLLILLFTAVMLRRATAPFLNEIILLERNPIWSNNPNVMTIRRRSLMLHGPASGFVISLAVIVGLYSLAIAGGLAGILFMLQGVLLNDLELHRAMPLIGWPLAMWGTAMFLVVVRFLSYLDLRIRHEGWEVELRMRAEGNRLAESLR